MSSSEFSMTCHTRSKRRRTSISSASMFSSLSRCSAATPSISSSISPTRSRMLLSVRMFARIWSIISFSKRFELRRGVLQVPLPFFSSEWQT